MEIGNNNLASRKAQLESKRAAVDHVCWGSDLQNWDWRKRRCVHVTNFEWNWLDLIGCRTDVCLTAGQHCTEEGPVRSWGKTSRIFQQWNLCYLVQVWDSPRTIVEAAIDTAERERKCIEQHFREDQAVWERRKRWSSIKEAWRNLPLR